MLGLVLDPMHVGLVEHHIVAIAPGVFLAVDENTAGVGVGRRQAQVVAQRTGERVAVRVQVTAAGQQREHGALDVGNAVDQLHGAGAQRVGRWQGFVVPLEVETLPAFLEERTEAGVVVLLGGADIALVEQVHGFVADDLPVVLEHIQLGEFAAVQIGFGRHAGKQVHQGVIGREQSGMVDELAQHRQTRLAPQVHVERAADEQQQHGSLGGEGKGHGADPRMGSAP